MEGEFGEVAGVLGGMVETLGVTKGGFGCWKGS